MNFADLPADMQREVAAALERMREEQARKDGQVAPTGPRAPQEWGESQVDDGLTYSTLRDGVKANMASRDLVTASHRFERAAEAMAKHTTSAGGGRQRGRLQVRCEVTNSRIIEVVPCVAFPQMAVVVAESDIVHEAFYVSRGSKGGAGDPESGAGGEKKDEEEESSADHRPIIATLELTWRSLHFAQRQAPPAKAANGDGKLPPDAADVKASEGAPATADLGPLTVQSMLLRACKLFGPNRTPVRRPFGGLPLPPPHLSGAEVDFARRVHLDMYTRPLTHFALAEILMRHNGREKIATIAAELIARGRMPKAGSAAGSLARGTSVSIAAAKQRVAAGEDDDASRASSPLALSLPGGAWVVLGLGAGCIPGFLSACLPPCVHVASVEIEPSVVLANRMHLGYPDRTQGTSCTVADATKAVHDDDLWRQCVPPSSDDDEGEADRFRVPVIFLDCYDPFAHDMLCAVELLRGCRKRLRPNGVLAINAHVHVQADPGVLWPFIEVFGAENVHVGVVDGYQQVLTLCTVPATPSGDTQCDDEDDDDAPSSPPADTLSGLWDYLTVARVASHGDVSVVIDGNRDAAVRRGQVWEGRGSEELAKSYADAAADSDGAGDDQLATVLPLEDVQRGGWLDCMAVAQTAMMTVKPPPSTTAAAASNKPSPVKVRRWLIPTNV